MGWKKQQGPRSIEQPFEVYASVGKTLLMMAGSALFVVAGIAFIALSWGEGTEGIGYLLVGIASAGFFSLPLFFAFVVLFRITPVLRVDAQGILDRSNMMPAGRITWEEIKSVEAITYMNQRFICLFLHDSDGYLARQSPLKRWLLSINRRLVNGAAVNIAGSVMDQPLERVYAEIMLRQALWAGGGQPDQAAETPSVRFDA